MHDSLMESTKEHTLQVPDVIPIFPLPKTILLPGELLPLHIFEHRYRDMVNDAVASRGVIGMVELAPGFEKEYLGSPPIRDVGCLGIIGQHKRLEDGRFLIWLFGIERFTVAQELNVGTRYRQAKVNYDGIDPQSGQRARIDPMRREIIHLLPRIVDSDEQTMNEIMLQLEDVDDPQLIALASRVLETGVDRKRMLLEASAQEERFLMICEDLYSRLETDPLFREMPTDSLLN
jgi:Lon protease-like protein